jgi:hypothetical protein
VSARKKPLTSQRRIAAPPIAQSTKPPPSDGCYALSRLKKEGDGLNKSLARLRKSAMELWAAEDQEIRDALLCDIATRLDECEVHADNVGCAADEYEHNEAVDHAS